MNGEEDRLLPNLAAMAASVVEALIDANRKKSNLRNYVEEATQAAVKAFGLE